MQGNFDDTVNFPSIQQELRVRKDMTHKGMNDNSGRDGLNIVDPAQNFNLFL
jgi:hypothetical protein